MVTFRTMTTKLTSSVVRRNRSLSPKGGSSLVLCISMMAGADREGGGFPFWTAASFVDICFRCSDCRRHRQRGFLVFTARKNDCVMRELISDTMFKSGEWFCVDGNYG